MTCCCRIDEQVMMRTVIEYKCIWRTIDDDDHDYNDGDDDNGDDDGGEQVMMRTTLQQSWSTNADGEMAYKRTKQQSTIVTIQFFE